MRARSRFARLLAQLLVPTLVCGSLPVPARASLPPIEASAPELPSGDSIASAVTAVVVDTAGAEEAVPRAVVFAVANPPLPSKYHRARWMDPSVGAFVAMDPWETNPFDPPTLHRYLYVHADPLNGVDPTGLYEGGISGALTAVSGQITLIGTRLAAGTITRLGAVRALRALNWTSGILTAAAARFGNVFVQLEHALERGGGRVDIVLRVAPQVARRAVIEAKAWSLDAIARTPGRAAGMLDQLRQQSMNYYAEFGDDLIYAFPQLPRTAAGQALLQQVQATLSSAGVRRVTFGVQQLMDEASTLLGR